MGAREKLEEAKAKRNARDAARRAAAKEQSPQNDEVEIGAGSHPNTDIFKVQKGLPSNVKAKELAKAKSAKKVEQYPIIYTQKGLKVIKLIVKPGKTVSVYVGNMSSKKHKISLEPLIKKWTAEGLFFREHEAKEKCSQIQAEYAAKGK